MSVSARVLSERFTFEDDAAGEIKCASACLRVRVEAFAHCGVSVAPAAGGDCQVGYRETVMTAWLLPG